MSGTLEARLAEYGQEHLAQHLASLDGPTRQAFERQLEGLNLPQLAELRKQAEQPVADIDPSQIHPHDVVPLPQAPEQEEQWRKAHELGLEALDAGRVGVVLVAGGQGSRLGFEHPKGMFPIGPVNRTPLFQIFAETILKWREITGCSIPWYVMCSPTNRDETVKFFEQRSYYGLPRDDVRFFVQGTMPAMDEKTGKLLLAEEGKLFESPNGHGGMLLALHDEGILLDMAKRGIDLVYYFQVDNPFAKICEPAFIGHHLMNQAEVSAKVVRKQEPKEKLGIVVDYGGKSSIIEYSDLPEDLAKKTGPDGGLELWTGSIAIHVFDRPFLERLTTGGCALPFHIARKRVPHLDDEGKLVDPSDPNAIKFELFIFDVLPLAKKVCVVETSRAEEFMPVKNAEGADSPAVTQAALTARAAKWLDHAGVKYPKNPDGSPAVALEISPLAGLTAEAFAEQLRDHEPVTGKKYFTAD